MRQLPLLALRTLPRYRKLLLLPLLLLPPGDCRCCFSYQGLYDRCRCCSVPGVPPGRVLLAGVPAAGRPAALGACSSNMQVWQLTGAGLRVLCLSQPQQL